MLERLLRVKEVAAITGEDCQTIYARVRRGELQSTKLGKRGVRISESVLREWLRIGESHGRTV